jgi:ketosteroid isomerase-like protein
MLICTKCNIEYEEGKKFCRTCGSPLVNKAEPPLKSEDKGQIKEKKPEAILICPKCKVFYETGKFCRKCGIILVEQVPLQEKEKPLVIPSPQIKEEPPLIQAPKEQPIEKPKVTPIIEQTKEVKKELPPIQIPEQKQVEKLKKETRKMVSPPSEGKKILRPLTVGIVGIVVLIAVAGYLLWPKYSHLIKKQPPSSPALISKEGTPAVSPSPEAKPSPPPGTEAQEIEKIKSLLENIRQANLQKNIDIFMSCYSVEFKDREGRRRDTLENWKNFDYLELSYDLKSQAISGETANARVEWFILTSPKGGGQAQESKAVLDVTFKKEDGGWKIKEIKSAG